MTDEDSRTAVGVPVQEPVRPRAWACVWPDGGGCGGGGFTTLDERTALNYMAGATERADSGRSNCMPALVLLYDQAALDAAVAEANRRQNANARLIAAAPARLEALKDAMQWFSRLQDWSGTGDPNLEMYRAAIAKAEGEKA